MSALRSVAVAVAVAALAVPVRAAPGTTPPAAPPAAGRKAPPPQVVKAAGQAFTAAVTADEAGDLRGAVKLYEHAFELAPHPNIAFNLGDVLARDGQADDAMHAFTMYLALAPDAADRVAVTARIAKLRAVPATLTFAEKPPADRSDRDLHDLVDAYILVDGAIVKPLGVAPGKIANPSWSGFEVKIPGGKHTADIVSAVTYGHDDRCDAPPGRGTMCLPWLPALVPGNVVISVSDTELRVEAAPDGPALDGKRSALPPGKHLLAVRDGYFECAPVLVDAPKGDDVRFVYVSTRESPGLQRCRAITVTQQLLKF